MNNIDPIVFLRHLPPWAYNQYGLVTPQQEAELKIHELAHLITIGEDIKKVLEINENKIADLLERYYRKASLHHLDDNEIRTSAITFLVLKELFPEENHDYVLESAKGNLRWYDLLKVDVNQKFQRMIKSKSCIKMAKKILQTFL